MLVDPNGLILHVLDDLANIPEYHGGKLLLAPLAERFPRLELLWTDSGYSFPAKAAAHIQPALVSGKPGAIQIPSMRANAVSGIQANFTEWLVKTD